MKWILIAAAAVAIAVLVLLVIGLLRPVEHVARGRSAFKQSPEELWRVLAAFGQWPEWNSAIDRMERLEDVAGRPAWSFSGKWGSMPSTVEAFEPPSRMVTRILDDADLGFSGSWEYEVSPAPGGSTLTITERGRVDSIVFRAMGVFHDNHASMRQLMTDLASHFGETVEMQKLE